MKKLGRPKTGSIYRRKGDKRYIVAWYGVNGKRHTRRVEGAKQDAQDFLDARKEDGKRGISPDTDKVYLDNLERLVVANLEMNGRASVDRAKRAYWHLKEQLATVPALQIPPILDEYIAERRRTVKDAAGKVTKEGALPATVRQELRWLGRGYRLASEKGLLPYRPALPAIEVDNARQGFFTPTELEALLDALPEHMKGPTLWAYSTGWRKGETFLLTWARCDLENGTARLAAADTKNRTARAFPYGSDPALQSLMVERRAVTTAWEHAREEICPWVFHRDGRRIRDFRTDWHRATKAAGLEGRLFHDLRRSFVRQAELADVPRSIATKLSGHKTESTYVRYAVSSQTDLEAGVAKIVALRTASAARRKG